jgi:NADH-quinone oxidoreductase subunit L
MLYQGLLGKSLFVLPQNNVLQHMAMEYQGPIASVIAALHSLPFWCAVAGILLAWICYVRLPQLPKIMAERFSLIYKILLRKYGFDDFNQIVFADGLRAISKVFFEVFDMKILDHAMVNGSGRLIEWCSRTTRKLQSGYLYHYAFAMIIGLLVLLGWLLLV